MRPTRAALLALAISGPGFALAGEGVKPDPTYLPELLTAARNKSLSEDRSWLRLGHWRKRFFGGWESEADGPGLFLSAQGKRDPAAELEATLTGFFAHGDGAPEGAKLADPSLEHPQCRFPARFAWLAAALQIDLGRLPPRSCPRFEAFWRRVSAKSVSLVFSSYYLNNPASAFGHTFLRLGKDEVASGGERLDLIDQAVDFAAATDTSNAILYAFEGLFGFFRGEFSARPYFYKVREYADYESRDLWEYELALDQRQLGMLVAHLWELGQTWFDYYYVTENCSYHILGALEGADSNLELLSQLGPATLPADSVKALFANPGLVRAVRFRPSGRTQLGARTAGLTGGDLDAVQRLAEGGDSAALGAMSTDEHRRCPRPRGRASRPRHHHGRGPGGRSSAPAAPRDAKRDRGAESPAGHSSTLGRRARTRPWRDAFRTRRYDLARERIGSIGRGARGAPRPGRSARRLLAANPD